MKLHDFSAPIKCGDMYVKFDDNNNLEYGFKATIRGYQQYEITDFVNFKDTTPNVIVLPKIKNKNFVDIDNEKIREFSKQFPSEKYWVDSLIERYANGGLKLGSGLFKELKDFTLVLPNRTSVMLDWGCFRDRAKVNLILPKNMSLKQVYRTFDTLLRYEHENWTIISNDDLSYQSQSYCGVSILPYDNEQLTKNNIELKVDLKYVNKNKIVENISTK